MLTAFLAALQETGLARWVAESPSLLGYPTILVLHTVGLALLVGGNLVLDLRLLGTSPGTPLGTLRSLFGLMWTGLAINAVTGGLLFMADAVRKAYQPVFLVKMACIACAVVVLLLLRAALLAATRQSPPVEVRGGRTLAVVSILFWVGALVAGRLVAYL